MLPGGRSYPRTITSFTFILATLVIAACRDDAEPIGPTADPAASSSASLSTAAPSSTIPGSYIVVFRPGVTDAAGLARRLVDGGGGSLRFIYTASIRGFAADLPERAVEALRRNPEVAYVEPDATVELFETETSVPSWGLDRVDQRVLPLDASYSYGTTGAGVNVYIIDTGIRTTHVDFGGRAVGVFSSVKGKYSTDDCHGHGTHVAGTVGGASFGVAKAAKLYAVRVLDCTGNGSWSAVIAGIDWVTANHRSPAVANMSLGGGYVQSVNDAVAASVRSGVVYSLAAGNSARDACRYSPGSTAEAITVAATSANDQQAWYSNWGTCVDLYAPGTDIRSAANTSDTDTALKSGTSMASPHVAGAAALYLETHPLDNPASVASALAASATTGQITRLGTGSPNLLLFTGDPATAQPSGGSGGGCKAKWKQC